MTAREHIVEDGDDIASIAHRFGFADTAAITGLPENADLLAARGGGALLFPGDVVFVPPVEQKFAPARSEATTTFTLKRPRYEISFVVRDTAGRAAPGLPVRLSHGDQTIAEGTSGDDGSFRCEVPAQLRELDLVVGGVSCPRVRVGALNPMRGAPDGGASGVAQRLRALGFAALRDDGSGELDLRRSIVAFKRTHGLADPDRANLDDALFDALSRHHGQ